VSRGDSTARAAFWLTFGAFAVAWDAAHGWWLAIPFAWFPFHLAVLKIVDACRPPVEDFGQGPDR
jgi:hypothetical protein